MWHARRLRAGASRQPIVWPTQSSYATLREKRQIADFLPLNIGCSGEAEPLFKRALAINEKALGSEHPDVGRDLNELALLYQAQRRDAEAEPLYKRALAIYEKALGPGHPELGTTLNNLAKLYGAQGRYAEAEPLLKRTLAINEKALGPAHPDVGINLNNLAALYRAQGRYTEAEPLYKGALAIAEKALGPTTRTSARTSATSPRCIFRKKIGPGPPTTGGAARA